MSMLFSSLFTITFEGGFPLVLFFVTQLFNSSDWLGLFVTKKRVVSNSFFAIQIKKNIDSYKNIPSGKPPKQQKI